jgi:hypothetical protein
MAADAMGEPHGSKNYQLEEQLGNTFTVTETSFSSLCLVGDLSKGEVSTEKARDNLVNAATALYNNAGEAVEAEAAATAVKAAAAERRSGGGRRGKKKKKKGKKGRR